MLKYAMEQVKVERENQVIDYATQLQYSIDRAIVREIVLKGEKSVMRSLANIPNGYKAEVAEVLKIMYKERGYQVEYNGTYCWFVVKLDESVNEEKQDKDDKEENEIDEDDVFLEICDNCGCVIDDEIDDKVIIDDKIYCCQDCADEAEGIVGYCDICDEPIYADDYYSFDEEECTFTCEACLHDSEGID